MNNGDVITFNSKKAFTYIKPLGSGGTGDTHLFLDETTGIQFAIKKYVPKDSQFTDEDYRRFVDEIIILFNISHPNIVRIYNYYLFPEAKTGYLQMEYVDGVSIDKFEPDGWGKDWNAIFSEVISAFEYLEQHNILHRDIRPANILIDRNENVKIIDFGFGKKLSNTTKNQNSILLNWPATEMPYEVQSKQEYDEQTEIYFVGVLFKHILKDDSADFRFQHISNLKEMNETFNYLRANGIYSLEDLESRVSEHSAATESLKKTLDEQTARMKAIKQLYDSSAAFQNLKPVYDGLQKIKFEKPRAKYKAEHEAELIQFYAARRKLTGEFPDGKVDMKKLSDEYDELEQAHETTYGEFKAVRDDLHRLWKVKSCVDTAARFNERTEEQKLQNRPQTRQKKEELSR